MIVFASNKNSGIVVNWKKVMKKPISIRAAQIDEDFEVETIEGVMKGKKGDWLMEGVRGEYYPCDAGIFEETYDICGPVEEE